MAKLFFKLMTNKISGVTRLPINRSISYTLALACVSFTAMASDSVKTMHCSGKDTQRNIQRSVLIQIDEDLDRVREVVYCGGWNQVTPILNSADGPKIVWYSSSPFVTNGFGEKVLDLDALTFHYVGTWYQSFSENADGELETQLRRSTRQWSASCEIISIEDAEKIKRNLRC